MSNNNTAIGELLDQVFAEAKKFLDNAEPDMKGLHDAWDTFNPYQKSFMNAYVQNAPSLRATKEFLKMVEGTLKSAESESQRLQAEIDGLLCVNYSLDTFVALMGLPFKVTVSKR